MGRSGIRRLGVFKNQVFRNQERGSFGDEVRSGIRRSGIRFVQVGPYRNQVRSEMRCSVIKRSGIRFVQR